MRNVFLCVAITLSIGSLAWADATLLIAALDREETARLLKYYRDQARKGDAHAQFKVGWAYETGDGLPQDLKAAMYWYRKSARQGHRNAQMNLAVMGDQQRLPEISKQEQQLLKLAEQGDIHARNTMARMLLEGRLDGSDVLRISAWILELARSGHGESQLLLGQMYERGLGVPQNYIQAYAWYSVVAAMDDELAMLWRDRLIHSMTPGQLEQGQELSQQFYEKYVLIDNHTDHKSTPKNRIGLAGHLP